MTGEVKRYSYAGAMHMPESPFGEYVTHAAHLAVVEGLRADAERYRFLRDVGPPDEAGYPTILQWKLVTQHRYSGILLFGSDLDAAIDEAMRGGDGPA